MVSGRPVNWALENGPWDALRQFLKTEQLSWSEVPFQLLSEPVVPASPGIYLVCARPLVSLDDRALPLVNILYVGKADTSVRARFRYHLSSQAKAPMKAARS